MESGSCIPKSSLIELFANPKNQYFTFNYTKTLQQIYGIQKVIYIHNRVGQKLIFGHGYDNIKYEEPWDSRGPIGSSFLNDFIASFRKDTCTQMKKYIVFFKRLNSGVDKIYSYGFSYSSVDSIYIKEIIRKISIDATWYFTEHETQNKDALRIKKIKLRRYGFKGGFGIYEG